MTQRRTPSGQGPARRPGQSGRPTGRTAGRAGARDTATRIDARTGRATPSRAPGTGRGTDTARSGSRPAAARRAATAGATKRTVATRPRAFTARATILLVVLAALALGYTYPVRVYLAQESQIAQMKADQAVQQLTIGGLQETVAKWQDPEYVRIKARERFYYVRPGEVPLVVYTDTAGAARDAGQDKGATAEPDRWYDTLWSSIGAANNEPRP
jgi:cell division protein FtsB